MPSTGHFLAFTFTRIELLVNENLIGSATGFFLKMDGGWYLVSNWHVFSGRQNQNGQPRKSSGAVPVCCRFGVAQFKDDKIVWVPNIYRLGDTLDGTAVWYEHPSAGQNFDIGVLPLGGAFHAGLGKNLMDPSGHDQTMFVDLGRDLFLPGYPLGMAAAGAMAIWKRASLASSLEFGEGVNQFFYVDTATREGMSGSPCLAIANDSYYSLDRSTNKMKRIQRPLTWRLLGVYSGRRNPSDSFEAQLGIVWRETLIYETIVAKKNATTVLR